MPPESAPLGGTDYPWAMFHHDPERTGATPASAPTTSSLMWTYNTGATIYSSPAVVDGTVYIATYDWTYNTGSLYAIDEYTGNPKWVFPTNGPIYSSPAVANNLVYITSRDSGLYALDARTGQLVWSRRNISPITSSPVVTDGKIFYGTWIVSFWAQLMALDAKNGTGIWQYLADDTIISSPSVSNGRVFFGQNNGLVVALDENTGTQIWNSSAGNSRVITAPAVAYGQLFVGTDNRFVAMNETSGSVLWSFNTNGNNATSAAAANGIVYFGTGRGNVHAVNASTGVEIWRYSVGTVVSSSPALALGSNTLVVGAHDGYIYALNMTDGTLLWRYLTGAPVSSSPAVADNRVFAGSQDHRVYGIGAVAPAVQASIFPSETVLKPGDISTLTITITNGTSPQSGASLTLASTLGGGFTTPTETSPGLYMSNYTAPLVTQPTDTSITVRAAKPGYLDDTAATTITLTPFPPLTVLVALSPSSVPPGGEVQLLITVRNGSLPVAGASVFLSSTGAGSFSTPTDSGNGNYSALYTADIQDSNPTLMVQASKDGFSAGAGQATITISGTPDLTTVKVFSIPLFALVAGLFLLVFVIFVALMARRRGVPDIGYHGPAYFVKHDNWKAYLRGFSPGFQWGWRP